MFVYINSTGTVKTLTHYECRKINCGDYQVWEHKAKGEKPLQVIFKKDQKVDLYFNGVSQSDVAENIFNLNPSKDASAYWLAVNKRILDFSPEIEKLWRVEKMAAIESIATAKEEALKFLASKREKIMKMTYDEAIKELINVHKIESRIETIKKVCDNGILGIR